MKKSYGLPYFSSKNLYVEKLAEDLPDGERFVDLFAGGGAVFHYLAESGRFEKFLIRDKNEEIVKTLEKATSEKGLDIDFSWVPYGDLKKKQLFERIIWSFGCCARTYYCTEPDSILDEAIYRYIVEGKEPEFNKFPLIAKAPPITGSTIIERVNDAKLKRWPIPTPINRMLRALRLKGLQSKVNLVFEVGDFRTYEHQQGDVVYCDPPYDGTIHEYTACKSQNDPKLKFYSGPFFNWAALQPYDIFVSEKTIPVGFDTMLVVNAYDTKTNYQRAINKEKTEYLFKFPTCERRY